MASKPLPDDQEIRSSGVASPDVAQISGPRADSHQEERSEVPQKRQCGPRGGTCGSGDRGVEDGVRAGRQTEVSVAHLMLCPPADTIDDRRPRDAQDPACALPTMPELLGAIQAAEETEAKYPPVYAMNTGL